MKQLYLVQMNSVQHAALIGILIEYAMEPDSTKTWEDVGSGEATSLDELLSLLTEEQPLELVR